MFTSIFLIATLGALTSCTVTVASALALLPLPSVAVSLTVFGPRLAQVKALLSMLRLIGPQASVVPPSTSAATMVAWPVASRFTSIFLGATLGAVTSCTVTVASALAELPLPSVAVSLTVFGPRLAQVKALLSMLRLIGPQASVVPPSTSAATMVAWPVASRFTSIFLGATLGAFTSCTVTVASALAELPLPSVAVSLTVFGPRLAQVKALLSMLRLIGPQASVVPPSTSAATMVAWPVASRFTSIFLGATLGAVTWCTVTVASALAELPLPSLAVSLTVFGPRLAQVKALLSMLRLIGPQASVVPPSTSAATMVAWPVASRFTSIFLGATLGAVTSCTVTVASALALLPLPSVAVSLTVFGPRLAQVKELVSVLRLLGPQASVVPPSTSAARMVAWPVASRFTSIFLVTTLGAVT